MSFAHAPAVSPWYRQRWPWLLMLGPAIVVVAGFATLAIAVLSDDGLVTDDYYKRGLAINRTLARTQAAATQHIAAAVDIAPDGRVVAHVTALTAIPPVVRLHLAHPTRAGLDHDVELMQGADGTYGGRIEGFTAGRWSVTLETDQWKLPQVEATGASLHLALTSPQP